MVHGKGAAAPKPSIFRSNSAFGPRGRNSATLAGAFSTADNMGVDPMITPKQTDFANM